MWELDHKEGWALKNWCFQTVVLVKTLGNSLDSRKKTLGNSILKEINPEYLLEGMKLNAAEAEVPIHWPPDAQRWLIGKHPAWCWERLRARGERSDRGWDGWMASLAQWTWVWANSGRWWRTGNPGVLQYLGSQRVRHNWATQQQQQRSDPLALLPFFPIQILHNSRILMVP